MNLDESVLDEMLLSPTADQNISESTLSSPDDSLQIHAGDSVQLDYRARPMIPREEEIMRIYEDRVYPPPDWIERPEGFYIVRFRVRPEERPV